MTTDTVDATEAVWRRQFADVADKLAPYAVTYDDGFVGIPPASSAPVDLVDLYTDLTAVGYARGWL